MPRNYHLNVVIDAELERALRAHVKASGLNLSSASRDLLRHALGVVTSERDAGWIEGFNAGIAQVKQTVSSALNELVRSEAEAA